MIYILLLFHIFVIISYFCLYFFSFILLFAAFLLIHCIIFILIISFALSVLFLAKFVLILPSLFGCHFFSFLISRSISWIPFLDHCFFFFFTKNGQRKGYQSWMKISELCSNSVLTSCIHFRKNALEKKWPHLPLLISVKP